MSSKVALTAMVFGSVLALAATATPGSATGPRMEKLADGVYAILQPAESRFDDANSLVIVDSDGVIVVDAQARPANVRAVIERIRTVTDLPVTTVINTHWHADHTQGNSLYRDEFGDAVALVGHVSLGEDVPQRAAAEVLARVERFAKLLPDAEKQLAVGRDEEGVELTAEQIPEQRDAIARARAWLERNRDARFLPPTRPYDETLDLRTEEQEVVLYRCVAHTRGDTLVYLPRHRILATGDVLDDLPYVGHGYPRRWLAALNAIEGLAVDVFVPGHGPVFRNTDKLASIRRYLHAVIEHVDTSRAAGLTLEETVAAFDNGEVRAELSGGDERATGFFDATVAEAVERAWAETADDPPATGCAIGTPVD